MSRSIDSLASYPVLRAGLAGVGAGIAFAIPFLVPSAALAGDPLVLEVTQFLNGTTTTTPSGPPPWLRLTFTDDLTNTVKVLIENLVDPALYPDANKNLFELVAVNVSPSINLVDLALDAVCSPGPGPGTCKNSGVFTATTQNAQQAPGQQGFDARFELPPPPGGDARFGPGDKVTYTLQATGLTAQSFNFANSNGLCVAAHAISLGPNTVSSTLGSSAVNGTCGGSTQKVPGPLPILGAAAAFGYSRKIRTRISSRSQATIS